MASAALLVYLRRLELVDSARAALFGAALPRIMPESVPVIRPLLALLRITGIARTF